MRISDPTSCPAVPSGTCLDAPGAFTNPVLDVDGVDHGDPFVLELSGRYFLYHSGPEGISCYEGDDLVTWEPRGLVLVPQGSAWGEVEFWAPEVVVRDGLVLMHVSATVRGGSARDAGKASGADGGDDDLRRQGVARSSSPLGPFVLDPEPLVPTWSIDGHPFTDDDGTRWLFYNVRDDSTRYVDGSTGCGNVVVRLDERGVPVTAPVAAAIPSQRWEGDAAGERYWNEGAWVIKRRGTYHQLYSGGFFGDDDYGLGHAVAPRPDGPWTKPRHGPVLVRGERISGPGHHSVVVAPDGATEYVVYHGYVGDGFGRKVHLDRLRWALDGPRVGDGASVPAHPTESAQCLPPSAFLDLGVTAFHLRAWVSGRTASVGPVVVDLDGVDHLLTGSYDGARLVVRRDGEVVADVELGAVDPRVGCDGEVRSVRLTSRLEDERSYRLREGGAERWSWGGRGPVEVQLSFQGAVEVVVGGDRRTLRSSVPTVASYLVEAGGDAITVRAVDGPAEVSDVVLAARRPAPAPTAGTASSRAAALAQG